MSDNFNLLTDVPVINNRNELKEWLKPMYIISDFLVDYDSYRCFQQKLYNIIKGCFVIKECREYPVKFKFNKKDTKTYELQFRHFIINTIVWYPFVELNELDVLNESYILDCENDIPHIENYINEKLITTLREYHIPSTTVNYAISEVLYNLRSISLDFSLILGLNFSASMFIDMYNDIPEMKELMECTFEENLQPHEIEQLLQSYEDREISILKQIPDNPLGIILRAGTGIKHKQLREFTISEGLKPTLTGETIPKPIENSTILRGLDRPSYLFIDALGARKSLVMNKKVMGTAGYFGKSVLLLARTLSISSEVSDCGTKHLVSYEITDKKVLNKLNGKYYKLNREDDLMLLDSKRDKHLIGKTILVRSVATCACGDNKVCAKCIGTTSVINQDISDGYSAFESEEITKVINQSILSTKHLLTTNSEVIEFNPEFYNFFTITGGEINPNVNDNKYIDNIDDYAIYINPEDICKLEEMDDDTSYNTVIYNGRFYIRNLANPDEKDICIQASGDKEMFISDDTLMYMKKGKGLIKFQDLDDDVKLFEMQILNNELTKPLYQIMDLLNKEKKDNINETIDSISQKFMKLLIEAKIDANFVAGEIIINRLIRSSDNIYSRPDFSKDEMPPYIIYTVRKALEKNKSPLIGLSYQNIKRQLLSDDFYIERNGTSYIDEFFKPEISTDNLKKYAIDINMLDSKNLK